MLLLLILLALPFTALWIWAIVDCVQNESDPKNRHRWLLIILIFSAAGALLYLLIRKAGRPKRLPAPDQSSGEAKDSIFVPRRR